MAGEACPAHPSEHAPARREPTVSPPSWPDPISHCLGEGGFATVWSVHPVDKAPYALKIAKAATELSTQRMRREAAALARVGAPWVPDFIDQGIDASGHAWLTMELIVGDNLGDLIARGLALDEQLSILRGLVASVAELHVRDIVHRDLKPDNVVVGPDGRVTVLDLGMALDLEMARTAGVAADVFAGTIAGSAEYMAPEQLDSAIVTKAADAYSLGVIAFEMLALRPPFVGSAVEIERGHRALRPPPLVDAPPELEALCYEALRKDPLGRPSAAQLLTRLGEVQSSSDPAAGPRRTTSTMAAVRERPQPVVLMWAELARLDRSTLAIFGAHKFRVVSQRGRRVLAAVHISDHPTPANEALAVAEELVALGARVVVHLADCVVAGERISGNALSAPESWLPAGDWHGLRMTAAFAAAVNRSVAPTREDSRFFVLAEESTSVLGRELVIEELLRAITSREGGPGLVLVTGAVGVGKSTVVAELARQLAERGIHAWQAAVTPPGRERNDAGASSLFASLVPAASDRAMVPDQSDAIRALARDASLVLLIDDVDLAEHELLDAIEYMTLGGGERCALWVVCFATEKLLARRPKLGDRAQSSRRLELPGLADEAAVALAARWLTPVDYLPVASLRPLLSVAQGNPLHIVSLCRELRERGAIRQREDGGHYLDTALLEQLPALALAPWMATRQLAGIPEETVALARVCAVLGESFMRAELDAVVEALDASPVGRIAVDATVGLSELCAAGIVEEAAWGLRFVNGLVCEGIYAQLAEEERAAVHHLAWSYWVDTWVKTDSEIVDSVRRHLRQKDQLKSPEDIIDRLAVPRIARHARAVGNRLWAARTCAELARTADLEHSFVEAEQQWSAALQFVDDDSDRAEALVGRARARYRQQRMADAIADAHSAAEIFRKVDDRERLVDALLEEATALDWAEDFETSAQRASEASACGSRDPRRQLRIALAERRAEFRRRPIEARHALRTLSIQASALGDDETAVIAAMLAGHAYLVASELDEANVAFGLGSAAYQRSGDHFHFACLLGNRIMLWAAKGEIKRSIEDMREAIRLAREHGQAVLERAASYNLAEELLWQTQYDEAYELAQRSMTLQARHGSRPAVTDLLLVLRIAAAKRDRHAVEEGLRFVAAQGPSVLSEVDVCFRDVLRNWLSPDASETARLLVESEQLLDSQQAVEVGWLLLSTQTLAADKERAFVERAHASRVHIGR